MSDRKDQHPIDPWTDDSYLNPSEQSAKESGMTDSNVDSKTWKLLEKAVLASVGEQRRSRRWGIFFKVLTFVYLFGALALFAPLMGSGKGGTTGHSTPDRSARHDRRPRKCQRR